MVLICICMLNNKNHQASDVSINTNISNPDVEKRKRIVWFYGVSTSVDYLGPNLLYTYILNMICKHIFKQDCLHSVKVSTIAK